MRWSDLLIAGLDIEAKDDSRSPGAPRAAGQGQFRLEMRWKNVTAYSA